MCHMLSKGSDSMIFGWPIEIIGMIFLISTLVVIYIALFYNYFKKYEKDEKCAGDILLEIEAPKRIIKLRRIDIAAAIGIFLFFYLSEFIQYKSLPPFRMEIGLVLTGAIASFYLNDKPQKVCENGILVSCGLVTWGNIKEVMPVDINDEKIDIKLYKWTGGHRKITLYCQSEDIMNVLHMIERKINFNPEIV